MELYIPFDSVNGDRRHASYGLARLLHAMISDGVFPEPGGGFFATAGVGVGLNIQLAPGRCIIQGRIGINDSPAAMVLAAPHASLPRVDRIVLRVSYGARLIEEVVKTGVPAANPEPPALQRDMDYWEISLARVIVAAGASTITQANIVDERPYETVCGFAAAVLPLDTGSLFAQFEAEFRAWFGTVQSALGDDVAGSLLNMILALGNRTSALEESTSALASSFTADGNFILNPHFAIWSRGYIDVVNPVQGTQLAERWKAFNPNNVPLYVVKHSNEHGLGGGITIQNTATGSGFGFYQTVETRYSELSGKEVTVTVFTSAGGLLETCQVAVGSVHSNLTRVAYDSEKVIFRGMIPAVLSSFVAFYFITGSNVAPSTFIVYGVTGTIGGAMMRLSTPNLTRDWQDCARYYLSVKNFMAHCFYPYSLDGPTFPVPMYKVPTILSYAINTPGQAPDTLIQGNWLITDQRIVYVNLVRQIQPYTSGFYSNYELSADL